MCVYLLSSLKMAKRKERRHLNKLLNNGGIATEGTINIQHDITCCICLETMDTRCSCTYTLDCGHSFHSDCLLSWYKKSNGDTMRFIMPYTDLDIKFFFNDCNSVSCPICKEQYTKELRIDKLLDTVSQRNTTLKKILGRINMLYCEDDKQGSILVTHYIVEMDTFKLFSPLCSIDDDNGQQVTIYKRTN